MRQVHIRTTSTQAVTAIARDAANFYEPWAKRIVERLPISIGNSVSRIPTRYLGQLEDVAKKVNRSSDLTSLFMPEAYELLCSKSASPFYLWRIVTQAAEFARSLPIQTQDIEAAVKEVSHRWHIGSELGRTLLERSFAPNLLHAESHDLIRMHREGYVVPKLNTTFDATSRSTMEINPLFVTKK